MKFHVTSGELKKLKNDCLIVGISEEGGLSSRLDKTSRDYFAKLLKKGDIQGKIGQTLVLFHVPGLSFERIILVGCGKDASLSACHFRKVVTAGMRALLATKTTHAILTLPELTVEKYDIAWKIKQAVEVCCDVLYQFNEFKSEKPPVHSLQEITLHIEGSSKLKAAEKALAKGLDVASGVEYTKNLANLPSNVCTPSYLAAQAKSLAKQFKSIKVKIVEENEMKKLGMGAFLAVAKGSAEDAKLVCLEYKGTTKKQAPVALVGKGITFDTGGISLKTADGMVGMKYDMCGAATVLGVFRAVAAMKLPIHLVGVLATAENMPSGTAYKPEDIVTTLSGQTVEVMNTDAEGRLVLCDALTWCERYKPDVVIDIATLTGAVVIALGHHATGMVSNHEPLAKALLAAGIESHDRAWQMPLWEEYQEQLKSPFADMSNVGGRSAGVITAGCFLSRFAKKFHWAHLDVAGTAAMMGGGAERYATGRPVPMLMQFLMDRCEK